MTVDTSKHTGHYPDDQIDIKDRKRSAVLKTLKCRCWDRNATLLQTIVQMQKTQKEGYILSIPLSHKGQMHLNWAHKVDINICKTQQLFTDLFRKMCCKIYNTYWNIFEEIWMCLLAVCSRNLILLAGYRHIGYYFPFQNDGSCVALCWDIVKWCLVDGC